MNNGAMPANEKGAFILLSRKPNFFIFPTKYLCANRTFPFFRLPQPAQA
jgi:hypothetical protein